jgi:hypothetical protein
MRKALLAASAVVAVIAVIALLHESGGAGGGGSTSPQQPLPPAKRITGPLHTDGTQMVGADGPVRLLGLDEPGLVSGAGNNRLTDPDACGDGYLPVTDKEFDDFQRFGFNSVRLGISWANMEPDAPTSPGQHAWNQEYLKAVDDAVKGFTSRGIAVIIDMHANNLSPAFKNPKPDRCQGSGLPVWLFPDAASQDPQEAECEFLSGQPLPGAPIDAQQGYADAWSEIAGRYADNKLVVAADIFNEPSAANCPDLDLLPFYEQMGHAIRAADPKLLLIYQDNAARSGNYALSAPLDLPDSVYSFHFYPLNWTEGQALLQSHLDHVASWKQPVWLGEFGPFREAGRGADVSDAWLGDLDKMMKATRADDVGWAFHQYSGGGGSLIQRSTGQVRTDWLRGLQAGF